MVDVCYHSYFGHEMLKKVTLYGDYDKENDSFMFTDGQDIYMLKKKDIEWIVPSHEDIEATSIPYVESPFIKSKTVLEAINEFNIKPMTNKEKFEEVFGMPPKDNLSICDIVDCKGHHCDGCKFKFKPWMMCDAWNEIWRG